MSVKSHQLPMTILSATEPTTPSPPAKKHNTRVTSQNLNMGICERFQSEDMVNIKCMTQVFRKTRHRYEASNLSVTAKVGRCLEKRVVLYHCKQRVSNHSR
ncbi:hypothetical protein GOODEAATRI_016121 [Goodea atripinnis]|uniref:Uncharacterized protein n=1 Tax=Goodea atripinnis TaxID=208336 RepID=A0ABV0PPI9_9TELE